MPTLDSGGTTLYYEVHGAGPPLLLVHAISAGADMWRPQVDHFAKSHRVITFDARGVGRSGPITSWRRVLATMAEDVRALLDHLDVAQAAVCGVSFGGVLAQQFAASHPDRVERLAIVDSYSDSRPSTIGRAAWLLSVYAGASSNLLPNRVLQSVIERQYRRWPLAAETLSAAVARLRGTDALKTRLAINLVNFVPALGAASFPILAVVGEDSWPRSMRFAAELRSAVPRTTVVRIPDSADPSTLCQPARFNEVLQRFLDS
ncbi:alpha/beta fold hydrolase [Actinoalloteichus hymeniacidonis]|uniref:Hydrolase or acyltransferase of alpha/beta superfamily n=1 Tax=Actinoalloteichus hymeniacidonis TaxID=340345 RepID=A0AAC9MZC2_9PSEU|nr:alpha/beta fold hydrolase [Actinoalloteichus hymeniacidonis]AOS63796.1 putative hydrolase or acyltransferase of alpha/beta superfamily [Actinoalloteichus hymeniacidonis]MBB5908150.1 pimeloyl-ACP methyl ester carboxylesterase [Actinoalloteichus hymeniacidonis]